MIAIKVTVPEPMTFPLHLKAPGWAEKLTVMPPDLDIELGGATVHATEIEIELGTPGSRRTGRYLPLKAPVERDPDDRPALPDEAAALPGIQRRRRHRARPLVFALPIEAEWKKVKDNPRFADWEVYPKSPWNYALADRPRAPRAIDRLRGRPIGNGPVLDAGRPGGRQGEGPPHARLGPGAAAPPLRRRRAPSRATSRSKT